MRRRIALALLVALPASAADLAVRVEDKSGEGVSEAVVYAQPAGSKPAPIRVVPSPTDIDQVDKEYVPHVTALRVGTSVRFPNHDQIRHHVYSFSEAKTFEIPLYKGTPAEPIVFDKTGVVVLGCNIHDWMKAYVFVTDAPYFAVTGTDGRASLNGVAAGEWDVRVWHPRLPAEVAERVAVDASGSPPLRFAVELKRDWRPRRAPSGDAGGRYR